MGLAQEINRRIRNKESEIADIEEEIDGLKLKLSAARAYIQGLQDILPKATKDEEGQGNGGIKGPMEVRSGTLMAQARDALTAAGRPLHLGDLLVAMGKENNAKNRLSVGGSLARYVRAESVFTRPAPNTFGLIGMSAEAAAESRDVLPEGFGK